MYIALHEVTWSMVVWCTQNMLRQQRCHVAAAMSVLCIHHFGEYSKTLYKMLVTHVEPHASTVSLLESGEQHHIKAINNNYNETVKNEKGMLHVLVSDFFVHFMP